MIRRSARILYEVVGAAVAGIAILVGLAAWRLSTAEPIQLRFLTPYLERALNAPDGSFRVEIGATVLAWRGWSHALDLDARDVHLFDARGSRIAAIPEIMVSLSGRALLQGIVAPQRITAVHPNIYLLRDRDGRLHFMRWHDSPSAGAEEESPILPTVIRTLSQPQQGMVAASYITDLVLSDGTLTFEDRRGGVVWKAPQVTIALKRGSGGIAGQVRLVVDRLGTPARLKADFAYDVEHERVSVDAAFIDVDALALGLIEPRLLDLGTLDSRLRGRVSTEIGIDGEVGATRFSLAAGPGTVAAPGQLDKPVAMQSLDLRGHAAAGLDTIEIDLAQLQLDGPRLAMSGSITGLRPGPDHAGTPLSLKGRIAIDGVPIERLGEFWPRGAAADTRDWAVANVTQGRVDHAEALVELDLFGGAPVVRRVDGGFRASNVTVGYLDGLPPIRGATGVAHFTDKLFVVEFTGGQSAGLSVQGGTVRITEIDKDDQHIAIRGRAEGGLRQALQLLDRPRFAYVSKVGIDPDQVEGRVVTDLSVDFPARVDLRPADIKLRAEAQLSDVALARGLFGRRVDGGQLSLTLDSDGMTLSGEARCEDVPTRLTWREQFGANAAFDSRFELALTADAAARARLGFDLRPYVDGSIPMKLVYTRFPAERSTLRAELGLDGAALAADFVAWRKAVGEPGHAVFEVEFNGEHPVVVRDISVQAGSLVAAGAGVFTQKGPQLDRLRLDRLAFANTRLSGVELDLAGSTPVITIGGGQIDASPLLEAENPVGKPEPEELANKPTQPFELRAARLDRVILGGDRALTNVAVTLRHDPYYWDRILLDATLPGGTALGVRYKARADRRHDLEIVSADAGDLLRTFDITDKVTGGRLQISGMADDTAPNRPLSGTAEIAGFRLTKTPFMVRLLSIATLTGLIDVLTGEGFQFDHFRAGFIKRAGMLSVAGARASGPSLGFTGDGYIDLDHSRLDMRGTIVPVYLLNNLLGNIPVIGNLLIGGTGQGLFAVTYRASGALEEPALSVNPLTALAPGFLRNLFQAQVPQAAPPAAAPPVQGPASPAQRPASPAQGPASSSQGSASPAPGGPRPPMRAPGNDR
ncbi:MAG: AsmA-like C-terminal domain-containing protein [Dongiaceae bacterium]